MTSRITSLSHKSKLEVAVQGCESPRVSPGTQTPVQASLCCSVVQGRSWNSIFHVCHMLGEGRKAQAKKEAFLCRALPKLFHRSSMELVHLGLTAGNLVSGIPLGAREAEKYSVLVPGAL